MSIFSGSVILTSSGGDYEGELNREKIYKFNEDGDDISFTPESIAIKCYSLANGTRTVMSANAFNLKIYVIGYERELLQLSSVLTCTAEGDDSTTYILYDVILDSTGNTKTFYFDKAIFYNVSGHTQSGTDEDIIIYNTIKDALINDNVYILIEVYDSTNNKFLASKAIPFEFGTSSNMAKFAVTANSIQAAVNNSILTFDETNGLTVQNGGFRIVQTAVDSQTQEVTTDLLFGYGEDNHTLVVKGSGEFSGEIRADSGSIGGFDIVEGVLYSLAGSEEVEGVTVYDNSLVKIDGTDGNIYAYKITLGESAQIEKYLQLGSTTRILNPDWEDNIRKDIIAITTTNDFNSPIVSLSHQGVLHIGSLTLDGNDSTISGNAFYIAPDIAEFSNVNISGKISAAVFEVNKVQAVGGSMLFKPAYKVSSYQTSSSSVSLILEENFEEGNSPNSLNGQYVLLVIKDSSSTTGQSTVLATITSHNGKNITLGSLNSALNGDVKSVIYLGKNGEVIIGVNSNNNQAANGLLKGQGFTISKLNASALDQSEIKTFLGNLTNLSGRTFGNQTLPKMSGFGLYGNNVYLTGSLVTEVGTGSTITYAGVNTLDGVKANFSNLGAFVEDQTPIVFWAGSLSTSESDIQNSPFIVTRAGTIYAKQGIFEGTIRSSIIETSDIYTARIHGGNSTEPGLAFFDQEKGITFYRGTYIPGQSIPEIFSIGATGFKYGNNSFISLESGVNFAGDNLNITRIITKAIDSANIIIEAGNLTFNNNNQLVGFIRQQDKKLYFGYGSLGEIAMDLPKAGSAVVGTARLGGSFIEGRGMVVEEGGLKMYGQSVFINNVLSLNNKIQYKPYSENSTIIGYDLYVL